MSRTLKRAFQKYVGGMLINHIAVPAIRAGLPLPLITPSVAIVVETVGRRTGTTRSTPLAYAEVDDGTLWVVAEQGTREDWLRNALADGGRLRLWLRGESHVAKAQVLEAGDPDEVYAQMTSRLMALGVKALAHNPKVVEIRIRKGM